VREIAAGYVRSGRIELLSIGVERKTRLHAEWTAGGSVERFFDYVPKGTRPTGW